MKKATLVFIISLLFLPLLVQLSGQFKGRELEGITEHTSKPSLESENYFNGDYQDSVNKYLDENFGLRNSIIRGYNQVLYSAFDKTYSPSVVIGKTGMLFIESYITSYAGINYVGDKKISVISHKIKTLQDTLKLKNKDLVIVFAPGKASFYPEYIPDYYFHPKHEINNYQAYKKAFDKDHVHYLDLNSLFVSLKGKTKYPLYPRYGTHWTAYGVALATDTLTRYIEALRNIDMPDIKYDDVILSDSLRGNDNDIGVLLNLYNSLHETMPYPELNYIQNDYTTKPSALAVGDSYWWSLVGAEIPGKLFKEDEYWFYNKDVYVNNGKQEKGAADRDIKEEILKRDVIIVMATEATLNLFPYGFIEKAYSKFCLGKEGRIQEIIESMDTNEEWLTYIKQNAVKNNVSLDEQKRAEAVYVYEQETKSKVQESK